MPRQTTKFKGVFAFIVTPSESDSESVDESRLRDFIDYQIESGVDGITVFGSTGGIGSFSNDERKQVVLAAARHIDGRVPLVAGTGSISTTD